LFSDVILPGGIDGAQLALEAQRLRPGLKALLTTGYAGDALAAMPDDLAIIDKPYRRDALAAKLRELLGENAPAAPTAGSFEADAAGE
jgi:DNA-binding LytR/AlgR family response regulator